MMRNFIAISFALFGGFNELYFNGLKYSGVFAVEDEEFRRGNLRNFKGGDLIGGGGMTMDGGTDYTFFLPPGGGGGGGSGGLRPGTTYTQLFAGLPQGTGPLPGTSRPGTIGTGGTTTIRPPVTTRPGITTGLRPVRPVLIGGAGPSRLPGGSVLGGGTGTIGSTVGRLPTGTRLPAGTSASLATATTTTTTTTTTQIQPGSVGSRCFLNSNCDSKVCIRGRCFDGPVADLEFCDEDADCENEACGLAESKSSAVLLCCIEGLVFRENVTWTFQTVSICGSLPPGSACSSSRVCKSGTCDNEICT